VTKKKPKTSRRVAAARPARASLRATPVTAGELRALQRELERRLKSVPQPPARQSRQQSHRRSSAPMRWNPDSDDVQRSIAQLVLTIVEFLRKLMERQAIRRMEQGTLTDDEVEAVGQALMRLEETIRDIGRRFGLTDEDLNLDLGPLTLM
jgi:hypothetical protein